MRHATLRFLSPWLLLALCFATGGGPAVGAEFDPGRLAEIRPVMQAFVDRAEIAGAVTLVGRHDRVAWLDAVGMQDVAAQRPMQKDSLFRIASMTKPITAAAIMLLADEGKLAVGDPVEKYLPEFRGIQLAQRTKEAVTLKNPSRPITLHDLLTHTSGMPGGIPLGDLYLKRDRTLAEEIQAAAKLPLEFEPGTKWAYCNVGIDTLGRVVEVVSGCAYERFLQQRIFSPLGMKDTGFYPGPSQTERIARTYRVDQGKLVAVDRDILGSPVGAKHPIPAGGLYSTAADLAQFYRMMLCRGTLEGTKILSPASVQAMTEVHTGELTAGFTSGMGFGLGWGVVQSPSGVTSMLSKGTFGHGGAFGTQGWIDPHRDFFVVMLIQRVGLPNGDQSEMRRQFQAAAVQALK